MAVAVVTGAGRGIGAAISEALGGDGHAVGLLARTEAELSEVAARITAAGGRAHVAVCDVTDERSVDDACTAVEAVLGPIAVLVNNAGTAGPTAPLAEVDPDAWWRTLETNLRGPMLLCRRVLPGMVERRHGLVVNINSMAATGPMPDHSAYAVSKTALLRLSETAAVELAGTSVSVVDISPGIVRTTMTAAQPLLTDLPDEAWTPPERIAALIVDLATHMPETLSGRFLHAVLDQPLARSSPLRIDPSARADGRRLRLRPAGDHDPLLPPEATATPPRP